MIFDGKAFARDKEMRLAVRVADLKKQGVTPRLMTILVGDNPESVLYLKLKAKFAQRLGVTFERQQFPEYVEAEEIINFIKEMNENKTVGGIVVQLPLEMQKSKNEEMRILNSIDPKKDIDGLTSTSFGLLKKGEKCFLPGVVRAVKEVMDFYDLWEEVRVVGVVGAKGWVGSRIYWMLKNNGIKEILEIDWENREKLGDLTQADLVVSCVGKPNLITANLVKEGAIVFDLGVMVIEKSKIPGLAKRSGAGKNEKSKIVLGDVDFSEIASKASFITPVPGGIGPVTVACLFENLMVAIEAGLR